MSTWPMFNRIASRYDLINRVVSFGQDIRWRRLLARAFPTSLPLRYLDLGTGTGDVLFTVVKHLKPASFSSILGMDMAQDMLDQAQKKNPHPLQIFFKKGDACRLPLENQSIDVISMAFAIRNVEDVDRSIAEQYRVLSRSGKLLILEFGIPSFIALKILYLFYFRYILPFVGGLLSGDRAAYRYLNTSVEKFDYGASFVTRLKKAGFRDVRATPLSGGIAYLYEATK